MNTFRRVIFGGMFGLVMAGIFLPSNTLTASSLMPNAAAPINRDCRQMTILEANYILACQDNNPKDQAYGAINNVYPANGFTYIVPSENAMAILGLIKASGLYNNSSYLGRARLAADYLIKVQDSDGAWYNQYSSMKPYDDLSKSPRQTAEVMIALYKLDYYPKGYSAMKKGAQYLLDCQNITNKRGNDDGLLGGGKDSAGQFQSWRWTHDNAYAYWALQAAKSWAVRAGENSLASTYAASAEKILQGINKYLYNRNTLFNSSTGVWHIAIDENGDPQWESSELHDKPSWIQYAPQMLDLPAMGVNSARVGAWIHLTFQHSDGSVSGYYWDEGLKLRKYPGLAFQAALSWYDTNNLNYANAALDWALIKSGLWQVTPDANGIPGGWIDWVEILPNPGAIAPQHQRYIDTSFYAIAACNGGYDFRLR